jgi:mono/diheme cytochrome c family protein
MLISGLRGRFVRFGLLALLVAAAAPASAQEALVQRGEYLATIMDCGGCHTGGALAGQPDPARHLAGSDIGFALPGLGVFYPPNLTSDIETGLGGWTTEEITMAIREGVRPDGRVLAPIMPWHSYGKLTDDDAAALVAYLQSLPAVSHEAPGPFGPDEKPTAPYLAPVTP